MAPANMSIWAATREWKKQLFILALMKKYSAIKFNTIVEWTHTDQQMYF